MPPVEDITHLFPPPPAHLRMFKNNTKSTWPPVPRRSIIPRNYSFTSFGHRWPDPMISTDTNGGFVATQIEDDMCVYSVTLDTPSRGECQIDTTDEKDGVPGNVQSAKTEMHPSNYRTLKNELIRLTSGVLPDRIKRLLLVMTPILHRVTDSQITRNLDLNVASADNENKIRNATRSGGHEREINQTIQSESDSFFDDGISGQNSVQVHSNSVPENDGKSALYELDRVVKSTFHCLEMMRPHEARKRLIVLAEKECQYLQDLIGKLRNRQLSCEKHMKTLTNSG